MEFSQLSEWCKEKDLDVGKAIVLSNVPVDVTDEVIYQELDVAKVFGHCKIRGRCLADTDKRQLILVETTKNITPADIPKQLLPADGSKPWLVCVAETQNPQTDDFQTKLMTFLAHEGKTLADIAGLHTSPTPTRQDVNTDLVNAISSLVDKCQSLPVDGQGYRKLRLFSGVKPTPQGEEEYDAWAEQTTHMLEEWQCPDTVKKQRIAESLKGPAADIVRSLRVSNPFSTAKDYLLALETAFGPTESAADLMVRFRNTFQHDGERLSAYLLRLDKLLHAAHRKGGVEVSEMNRARIDQVARGSLSHNLVALRIRMTYKLKPPPSFTELLRDVREEEEMILERQNMENTTSTARIKLVECVPKFPGRLTTPAVLIERPEEGVLPEELLVMPVIEKPKT
uniref:Uncharacterized protein n=1 Tax=Salarias fasciatus TaxID=181472 RepID=A0A672G823_SALFA